jgi:hypothetical protein
MASGLVVAALVIAGVLGVRLIHQPFKTKIVDRTPPVTLQQLRDLAEYKAASANFEVLIDIEKDVKWLPSAIAGERTFFVGVGSVDAVVDFGALTAFGHSAVVAGTPTCVITSVTPSCTETTIATCSSRKPPASCNCFARTTCITS